MLIGYIFLFVGIVFFSTVVLNLEPVKFFIEDILGKNVQTVDKALLLQGFAIVGTAFLI